MPRMDEAPAEDQLVKLLLIGDGKCGKTPWAAAAAVAGFNVLYLDGDVGRQSIMTHTPAEVRKRIYLMDFADTVDGGKRDSKMWESWRDFTSSVVFKWNDSTSRVSSRVKDQVGDTLWHIKPALLDNTCVLVVDSWTSLIESIMLACASALGLDLAEATTAEMRPVYQGGALKTTQALQIIRSLRCHVIVIAHPDEFSHTTRPDGRKVKDIKETDLTIDWTKMIPKTTSKPQGLQMPKYFSDIAWMDVNASGTQEMLDFRRDAGRVSGGHFDDRKNAREEYSFANLVKKIGGMIPVDAGVDSWLTVSQVTEESNKTPVAAILSGTGKSEIKQPGIAAFMKKAEPTG